MKRYIINVVLNNHNILESSCQYIVIMEAVVNIIMIVSARSVTAPVSDTPLKILIMIKNLKTMSPVSCHYSQYHDDTEHIYNNN